MGRGLKYDLHCGYHPEKNFPWVAVAPLAWVPEYADLNKLDIRNIGKLDLSLKKSHSGRLG
jgi:hypothetical protein